jgi:hypothetical protein
MFRFVIASLVLLLAFAGLVVAAQAPAGADIPLDWLLLETAWKNYLAYPSGDNGRKVSNLLPSSGHVKYSGSADEKRVLDGIYSNLGMVELQANSGDREAVRLLFRLPAIADGAFSEDISILLGALTRIQPKLFLEEFKNRPSDAPCGSYVKNFGPLFVDHPEGKELEAQRRIKALLGVRDAGLREVRDQCVAALSK